LVSDDFLGAFLTTGFFAAFLVETALLLLAVFLAGFLGTAAFFVLA
jgi:uncharacterized membrane protein YqaE (UPF0057 family)